MRAIVLGLGRTRRSVCVALVVGAGCFGVVMSCKSAVITYAIGGTVDGPINMAFLTTPFAAVAAGDGLTLTFSIDTGTPQSSSGPGYAFYDGAIISASVALGSTTIPFDTSSSSVYVSDVYDTAYGTAIPAAFFTADAWGTPSDTFTGSTTRFVFANGGSSPLTAYSDTSLSNAPLQPAWGGGSIELIFPMYVNGALQGEGDIRAGVNTISTVPLPAAAWLLLSGLGGLGLLRRRSRALDVQLCGSSLRGR